MPITQTTPKTVLHRADTRGDANHGWLDTHHTFSFAGYSNPERMHFGVLRVLNDDVVAAGKGFGTHAHDNMEIVSIPLEGDLEHRDSMGNREIIREADVQVMSAGRGVRHSEYNANADRPVKFLQIWMFPNERNVMPRYDQISVDHVDDAWTQVLSPDPDDAGVWVHQNAWWSIGRLGAGHALPYELHAPETNGVYVFVLDGQVELAGEALGPRDGLGVWDAPKLEVSATSPARVLLMEVPMAVG